MISSDIAPACIATFFDTIIYNPKIKAICLVLLIWIPVFHCPSPTQKWMTNQRRRHRQATNHWPPDLPSSLSLVSDPRGRLPPGVSVGDVRHTVDGPATSCTSWWFIPLFGYGSIPINTIFRGMTIHLPAILGFTRGIGFWPIPLFVGFQPSQIGFAGFRWPSHRSQQPGHLSSAERPGLRKALRSKACDLTYRSKGCPSFLECQWSTENGDFPWFKRQTLRFNELTTKKHLRKYTKVVYEP